MSRLESLRPQRRHYLAALVSCSIATIYLGNLWMNLPSRRFQAWLDSLDCCAVTQPLVTDRLSAEETNLLVYGLFHYFAAEGAEPSSWGQAVRGYLRPVRPTVGEVLTARRRYQGVVGLPRELNADHGARDPWMVLTVTPRGFRLIGGVMESTKGDTAIKGIGSNQRQTERTKYRQKAAMWETRTKGEQKGSGKAPVKTG